MKKAREAERTMWLIVWVFFTFWATLFSPTELRANQAAALLLEKKGTLAPNLETFSEIPIDVKLSLLDRSTIQFLHYHTCHTVTVTGGTVELSETGYEATGGDVEESQTPCPRKHTVAEVGQLAGVRIRGSGSVVSGKILALPPRPNFILVGKRARDFSSVRISKEGTEFLDGSLEGASFRWPATADSLVVDSEYQMTFVPATPDAPPISLKFNVSPRQRETQQAALTLINLGE